MSIKQRIILGIDPGLAHTGWGIVEQNGSTLTCLAYGCIETTSSDQLPKRLLKINQQMSAVVNRYQPTCVSVETVWFGSNAQTAFATGQARGAALAACGMDSMVYGEYSPKTIKKAIVGIGDADKGQVQYMVQNMLRLSHIPKPDHAADALAAAITFTTHNPFSLGTLELPNDKGVK
ncbi:MAG: crossover junction endodeoxyribonuclease RuvC [Anaerotardibacter sp.]